MMVDGTGDTIRIYEAVDKFGISFGVGLPVGSENCLRLNLGFELGQRGSTTDNGLVKENYL